jgi:hypothetical protein
MAFFFFFWIHRLVETGSFASSYPVPYCRHVVDGSLHPFVYCSSFRAAWLGPQSVLGHCHSSLGIKIPEEFVKSHSWFKSLLQSHTSFVLRTGWKPRKAGLRRDGEGPRNGGRKRWGVSLAGRMLHLGRGWGDAPQAGSKGRLGLLG